MKFQRSGERILLTFWVGGAWAIGYVAVPLLFATVDDKAMAGQMAGRLIQTMTGIGLVAAGLQAVLWLLRTRFKALADWRSGLLIAALVGMAVTMFWLIPEMDALRAAGDTASFGRMHGIASTLHLAVSVLGLALVVFQDEAQTSD